MMWIYAIIVIVILVLYGASITFRYLSIHSKYHKQKIHKSLHDVLSEIMNMIHKEDNMDKGAYKNTSDSRPKVKIMMPLLESDFDKQVQTPTLTDLLTYQPTNDDYEAVLDLLVELCQLTYKEFAFFLAKSSDETKAANFMQIESPYHEHTELHKDIFRLAVKYNLDMKTLQDKFAKRAVVGDVIQLGEGVTMIYKDKVNGQVNLATAVMPIQSGIEGSAITFIFSFVKTENYDEWCKNMFPEHVEDGE